MLSRQRHVPGILPLGTYYIMSENKHFHTMTVGLAAETPTWIGSASAARFLLFFFSDILQHVKFGSGYQVSMLCFLVIKRSTIML